MALSRKQKKAFLTAAVTAGVYLSFRYLLPLIFPFLAAYLMALLLQPSAAFLEKRLRISFRGRMIGVLFGALSYDVIDKIIIALKMDALIQDTIKGVILIIVIMIQVAGPKIRGKLK